MVKATRRSRGTTRASAGPSSTDGAVERALEKIHDRYRIGKDALVAGTEGTPNDGKTIARLAEEKKLSKAEIRHARLFARYYTEDELEALLALRCKGVPFTWDHVKEFVKVRDKDKRAALQEQAAEKSWSSRALRTEIRARGVHRSKDETARRGGGRRYPPPANPRVALVQILDLSGQLNRYYEDIGGGGEGSPLTRLGSTARGGRRELIELIQETKGELERLSAAVASMIKQLRAAEGELQKATNLKKGTSRAKTAAPKSPEKTRRRPQEPGARPRSGRPKRGRRPPPK